MCHKFLFESSLHVLLNKIDQEFADKVQQEGCSHCGGRLDRSDYPRSPFGVPPVFREHYDERLSFCCSDCRKRTTPPSVRFFGRRWFIAPIVILISALSLEINERRLEQIKKYFGVVVSESTWKRWRSWWRNKFVTTPFWRQMKGLLPSTKEILNCPFPRALFFVFEGTFKEKIYLLLRFLAPLTGGVLRAI